MTRSALLRQIRILPASLILQAAGTAPEGVSSLRLALLRSAAAAPPVVLEQIRTVRDVVSFVSAQGTVYNNMTEEESVCPAP